ncbi:MAG: hypothetical protein IK115_00505 [Lachnospiraceae bacterium]|nr:hypothetical protein [Lachnospiraceae bacterium]
MKEILSKILAEDHDFGETRQALSFSCEELVCEMPPDRRLHGSFSIYSADGAHIYVYSGDLRILIENEEYNGKNAEVCYTVDSFGLPHGAVHEGSLQIISDHGEFELPYRIVVSGSLPDSSMGEIRNLFHFANLAKADWEEALSLFYSDRFSAVLNGTDAQYRSAYRGFSATTGNSRNMENFLEVSRKKTRADIRPETEKVDMMLPRKSMRRHIRLVREGWGYSELQLSAEGDFLAVEQETLLASDFPGNVGEFSYIIDLDGLHTGMNTGALILREGLKELRIPVCVDVPVAKVDLSAEKRIINLMQLYIDYRVGRLGLAEFATRAERLIERVLSETPDDLEYRLYQAQLRVAEKRLAEAAMILERIEALAEEKPVPPEQEAYRLWLSSICDHDPEQNSEYLRRVEELYRPDSGNWRLAWIHMNMDPDYRDNDRRKWRMIKLQYTEYGNASPVLLLEAYHILVQAPKRMDELGDFELALMRFALRKGILSREMTERMAILSMDVTVYNEELCRLLMEAYMPEESVVLLEAVCLMLIRGNVSSEEAFVWYSRAIERELRISRLYEYYICSAPLNFKGLLPRILLMYFAYRSPLDAERNAFLYANVLRHRSEYSEVYDQYLPVITEFAREQLEKGNLNDNLAYIYKKLFSGKRQEQWITDAYTELLFCEEISVQDPGLKRLVVVYEHLEEEQVWSFFAGKAVVPLYGEHFSLLLEDERGDRYGDEELYSRKKLLKESPDAKRLLNLEHPSMGAMLALAEMSGDAIQITADNADIFARLSESEGVTEEYRLRIMIALAEYYFDADEIVSLDDLLLRFDPLSLSAVDREKCVHIMVARGLYDEAFEWVCRCGSEGIDVKILVRLCDRLQARRDQEYNPEILKICRGILLQGRYDEEILNYLLRYGRGNLKERKELWRAADSFGLEVQDLLESMMLQQLFTGVMLPEKEAIWLEHISGGIGTELEQAYAAVLCYDYFMKQEAMGDKLFDRLAQLCRLGEELKQICILAWLKHASEKPELSEEERSLCEAFLRKERELDIFLPFFTRFSSMDPFACILAGQSFVEYVGREGSQVVLHYVRENEGEEESEPDYRREEMQHVYGGIYVKRFPLFFGERIHYYITEEDGRTEKLTRSSVLEYSDPEQGTAEDRFTLINNIAIAEEMNDEVTFLKLFRDYDRQKHMCEHLFLPAGTKRE